MVLNEDDVSQFIFNFITTKKNPVLFAGAGVSAYAGLPNWSQFLELLANHLKKKDPMASALMMEYIGSGHFCEASNTYKNSPHLLDNEKFPIIEEIFKSATNPGNLCPLVSLPFTSIVTTNYDNALHTAYSIVHQELPKSIELSNETLKKAMFLEEFHIARIHGQFDLPEKIIFSQSDYDELQSNTCYTDFMVNLFTRKSCLFIGFSFFDPAISHILSFVKGRFSVSLPNVHCALLPSDQNSNYFTKELEKINVEVASFDSKNEYLNIIMPTTSTKRKF